ncbi:hypothetical protein P9477_17780 [Enterobacter mori]|uniref:hypothetical protein n=1 Tax=Enterobacter mori TaxID=539813 RepID=UPI00398BB2D3
MYRLSKKEKANRPLLKLLNNGYKFALIGRNGAVLKPGRFKLEIEPFKKMFPGSKIMEIEKLLQTD